MDACSNIGQELSKSGKSTDMNTQHDARKPGSTASPSNSGSKPNSPPPPYSQQQRIITGSVMTGRAKGDAQKDQLSAAATLASQYQMMYQQLIYQSELEYLHKSKGASAAPTALKTPQELAKTTCTLCRMNPGYTGYCVHDNSSINQMLAMLNPGSAAAAVLAYSSKLASLQQPYADSPLTSIYPSARRTTESSKMSPTSQSVESRRTSDGSITSTSPRRVLSPRQTNSEQPMDLHVEKSKSPSAGSTRLIECHWVGAEGYCGRRFHSSDDLMYHLKHHVANCPNVVVEEDNRPNSASRQPSMRASPTQLSSYKQKTSTSTPTNLLTIGSKQQSPRFQPYSVNDRVFPSALLLGTQR